jgi:hypothetical protein
MKRMLAVLFLILLASCSRTQTCTVTLAGYNYTDRPISGYSVDGAGGGNMLARQRNGGSGWACCAEVTVGKPVHIEWTFSSTGPQYEAGMRSEDHELTVIVPKPEGTAPPKYMEVHFYSDNHIELNLVPFPRGARWPAGTDMSNLIN